MLIFIFCQSKTKWFSLPKSHWKREFWKGEILVKIIFGSGIFDVVKKFTGKKKDVLMGSFSWEIHFLTLKSVVFCFEKYSLICYRNLSSYTCTSKVSFHLTSSWPSSCEFTLYIILIICSETNFLFNLDELWQNIYLGFKLVIIFS